MPEIKYKTYNEVWDKPIKPYQSADVNGNGISIMPKNPKHHQSCHPLEQVPTLFYNLDQILLHPHKIESDSSNNPVAVKSRKKGKSLIYLRNDFIKELKIPGYCDWKGDQTIVVVMYENTGKNYTKTYRVIKK